MLKCQGWQSLEALPVHDTWARLIVLLFWNPHLLEGWEWGEDGAADPYGILTLRWSNYLYLHRWGGKGRYLLLHSISNTWIHCRSSRQYRIRIQVLQSSSCQELVSFLSLVKFRTFWDFELFFEISNFFFEISYFF